MFHLDMSSKRFTIPAVEQLPASEQTHCTKPSSTFHTGRMAPSETTQCVWHCPKPYRAYSTVRKLLLLIAFI